MPADLPVAAPDHADEIRAALKALRGWLPEPQNKVASGGYDAEIVKVRRAHKAGLAALGALLAERQQDKERIERLETALSVYADPRHWAISRDDLAMRVVSWIDRLLCRVFGHCYDAYRIPIRCKCCGQRWRARGSHD